MTHADDPVCHALDFTLPFLVQFLLAKDGSGNASTVQRRVRVHGSDHNLELTVDAGLLLGVLGNQRECTDTFTIQAHVLRERLRKGNLVTLRYEVTDSEGVSGGVARGESLIGHIEEGEETLLLDNVGDLNPLFGSGIDAGGIVRACVEEHDRLLGNSLRMTSRYVNMVPGRRNITPYLEVLLQAREIETDSLLVKVSVSLDLKSRVTENGYMVAPCWEREID